MKSLKCKIWSPFYPMKSYIGLQCSSLNIYIYRTAMPLLTHQNLNEIILNLHNVHLTRQ